MAVTEGTSSWSHGRDGMKMGEKTQLIQVPNKLKECDDCYEVKNYKYLLGDAEYL